MGPPPEGAEGEEGSGPEGGKPPKGKGPGGECGKILKAAHKAKAKCDHHKEVVGGCIDELEACATDGGVAADCAEAARSCLKAAAEARFAEMCEHQLAKCSEEGAPAEQCTAIEAHCAEGPKAPPAEVPATDVEE